jgi:hypothetical protein
MGEVTIRFSSPMKTNVNLTDLEENLEMYIAPNNDWNAQYADFNMSKLNFTFTVS